MNCRASVKFFCVLFSLLITLAAVSATPLSDYDNNLSDIFDILMQKENMDDATGIHQIVRKSRGPQLRLRFGKRSDYERHPYLRLRFGKRSEDSSLPISAYMPGFSSEGEN